MIIFLDNPHNYHEIDHIDRDKTNNHISNLRFTTRSENNRNKSKYQNTSSKYKGVYFHKCSQKWTAQCAINGKIYHIGVFETEVEGARAYNEFCVKHNLTTAVLNEIERDGN